MGYETYKAGMNVRVQNYLLEVHDFANENF